jgi:hypothetical protein
MFEEMRKHREVVINGLHRTLSLLRTETRAQKCGVLLGVTLITFMHTWAATWELLKVIPNLIWYLGKGLIMVPLTIVYCYIDGLILIGWFLKAAWGKGESHETHDR